MRTRDLWRRARRRHDSRGAAAVEFALVCVVLMPLLFGIIEYGLWFNDSLNVRQGVREAARAGVVKNFAYSGCNQTDDMAKLACKTKKEIGAVTGTPVVKIAAPNGWVKAKPLIVCAMVKADTAGLVPLPNDRMIRSRTEMSIEVTDSVPSSTSYADTDPTGKNWSWCT